MELIYITIVMGVYLYCKSTFLEGKPFDEERERELQSFVVQVNEHLRLANEHIDNKVRKC